MTSFFRKLILPLSAFTSLPPSSFINAMAPLQVRVASYNVLSSHLADPNHFSTLNPDHLKANNRLPAVLQKIDEEIHQKSIICLQEVSYDWAGSLHTHFANQGYHFVTGLYGKKFNGYMGVGIAFPTENWKVLEVDISRLADKREAGWPREPKDESLFTRFRNQILGRAKKLLELLRFLPNPKSITDHWAVSQNIADHWAISQNRFNVLVTIKLQDKKSQKSFCVGNYHMPCLYYAPMVMTIHTDLAARHVQRLAEKDTQVPYILAGDWNIKPEGSSYQLLTTGMMDKGDPEWPTPKFGVEWEPTAKPMRSAYADAEGKEPNFTNYARIREDPPFIDTLDYIFLSPEWSVKGVKSLPHRDDADGPFPNLAAGEPSDHILIAADLELK
jgi:mRNA deadenylase 3'-5' endonuclease subunit Ccr4